MYTLKLTDDVLLSLVLWVGLLKFGSMDPNFRITLRVRAYLNNLLTSANVGFRMNHLACVRMLSNVSLELLVFFD